MTGAIEVTLSCSPAAREVFEQMLRLAPGTTVADAVKASGLSRQFPDLDWRHATTPGIWGRAVEWDQALKAGDRVELCRPLDAARMTSTPANPKVNRSGLPDEGPELLAAPAPAP